jgi:hypothetical protein
MGFIRERMQAATPVAGAFCAGLSLYRLIWHFTIDRAGFNLFATTSRCPDHE